MFTMSNEGQVNANRQTMIHGAAGQGMMQSQTEAMPMPRSDVEHSQEFMDAQIDQLQARMTMLENRLLPVLAPRPINGEEGYPGETAAGTVAPLVLYLGTRAEQVQAINNRIDALLRMLAI